MAEDMTYLLSLVKAIRQIIEEERYDDLQKKITDGENIEELDKEMWEIVEELCHHLTQGNDMLKGHLVIACKECLLHVAISCKPKETLLAFLEQLYDYENDVKFHGLLSPIQVALLRLPSKRHHSLDMTLAAIYSCILKALPEVKEHNLEGDEKLLLSSDPAVRQSEVLLSAALDFAEPFIEEISTLKAKGDEYITEVSLQQKSLAKFLLRLLDKPVRYLDLDYSAGTCRRSCVCLMKYLTSLYGDIYKMSLLMEKKATMEEIIEGDECMQVNVLSFAVLQYIVLHEHIAIEHYPQIFTQRHVFEMSIMNIITLIIENHPVTVSKGVALATTLVSNIPPLSLDKYLLESVPFQTLLDAMANVMIKCPIKETRQAAVKCIPIFLRKFDSEGRNEFLYQTLKMGAHPGLVGYIIQLFKDEIDRALKSTPIDVMFIGSNICRHLDDIIFRLPGGVTVDLLENSDHIMAALNLLRYLVLRDPKKANITGIWNRMADLEKYNEKLHKALDVSRAHFKMELHKVKTQKSKKDSVDVSLSVGGADMPKMPRKQQAEMLEVAIDNFDMMQSVLVRVQELIEHAKRAD